MRIRTNDDSGQVAVIVFFFLAIGFIAFYFIILGGMMDQVTDVHNNITQNLSHPGDPGIVPLSAGRQESMLFLQGAFGSMPIIGFILLIITAIIAGLASRYQII